MMKTSQNEIFEKTINALGCDVFQELRNRTYCIVGCGGIGANFAEMLARTGVCKINLIDGDEVAESNLNRVFCFNQSDYDKFKVEVIREKLLQINPEIQGENRGFRFDDVSECCSDEANAKIQSVRDLVYQSDVVGIFCDCNKTRISLEKLCREKGIDHISAAIRIDPDGLNCKALFNCGWWLETPEEKKDGEGYANNASMASIIMECTSVAFSMMLSNLDVCNGKGSKFYWYEKTYEGFIPKKVKINDQTISLATQ